MNFVLQALSSQGRPSQFPGAHSYPSFGRWESTRQETRYEYLGGLRRTAVRLPKSFMEDSVADMARRCKRLHEAKGGHFEEGGSSN